MLILNQGVLGLNPILANLTSTVQFTRIASLDVFLLHLG